MALKPGPTQLARFFFFFLFRTLSKEDMIFVLPFFFLFLAAIFSYLALRLVPGERRTCGFDDSRAQIAHGQSRFCRRLGQQ